jgi:hypothetical protein
VSGIALAFKKTSHAVRLGAASQSSAGVRIQTSEQGRVVLVIVTDGAGPVQAADLGPACFPVMQPDTTAHPSR